jgi:DNA-binding IclR family transcriptional regulator
MAVLDLLEKEREAMSLGKLASSLSLPKSSVHGLCNTLTALGYLRRQTMAFLHRPRVMGLANAFAAQTSPAQEFERLWNSMPAAPQETVILSVLDGADVVYVAVRNGSRPLGLAFSVGMRLPGLTAPPPAARCWPFTTRRRSSAFSHRARLPAFLNQPSMRRSELMHELALTPRARPQHRRRAGAPGRLLHGRAGVRRVGRGVAGVGICLQKASLKPRFVASSAMR